MSNTVIEIKNLSKRYQLGKISTRMLSRDISSALARLTNKVDPNSPLFNNNIKTDTKAGKIWALKDINLNIQQGEILGVIGGNGAGKSTLLKILSRITSPTSGTVKIRGRIASLLEVGTGFHPELTGKENIYLNGAILGMTKKEISQKLEQIIEFSGISSFIDTPVKRYSTGMRVRLAFSVAAHLDPEILLIDEVLAVGDADFQRKCLGKMENISNSGRTILFVSHNMSAIKQLCQKAIVLNNGLIEHENNTVSAVNYYLGKSQNKIVTEYKWDYNNAPGNSSRLKIIGVKIRPTIGDLITVDSGISFSFKCITTLKNSTLNLGFEILSIDGAMLIHTYYPISDPEKLVPGNYKVIAHLPPHILNKGIYNLNIWYGLSHFENLGVVKEKMRFEVGNALVDCPTHEAQGILNPVFTFERKYISDNK